MYNVTNSHVNTSPCGGGREGARVCLLLCSKSEVGLEGCVKDSRECRYADHVRTYL